MSRFAFLIGIIAAASGVGSLYLYMQRFEAEVTGGDAVTILMAIEDIPLGSRIREDTLAGRTIPARYVEERHVRIGDLQRIVGIRVTSTVKANEALLWTDLASSAVGSRRVEQFLQEGMRALTVNGDGASSSLLAPGNRIDIFLTTSGNEGRQTLLLLQNVIVIAVGGQVGTEGTQIGGRSGYGGGVTLSVLPRQASYLTLAQRTGSLTFAIRSSNETGIIQNPPPTTVADLRDEEQIREIRTRAPAPAPTRPQRPVEFR